MSFVTDNTEIFQTSTEVHEVNTRHKLGLYRPAADLQCTKKNLLCRDKTVIQASPCNEKRIHE
jgi:hypothetical protein